MPMRTRGHDPDERGVEAVELAIIAPTLLLLIFLIIQGGLYFYGRSVALQAAREGVSELRLQQTQPQCEAYLPTMTANVVGFAARLGSGALNGVSVAGDPDPCAGYADRGGSSVTVTVKGHSISLIGFTIVVTESSTGRVEQFQDEG
jgi:Flp pilus assembly protein TadG